MEDIIRSIDTGMLNNDLFGVKVLGDFNGEIKLSDCLEDISSAINMATTTGEIIYTNDIQKLEKIINETPSHKHNLDTITISQSQCLENACTKYCTDILEGKGESKSMEILKIYKERKATQLLNDYEEKLYKITQEDSIKSIINDAIEQIKDLYPDEYEENTSVISSIKSYGDFLKTEETIEKENELTIEYEKSVNELNDLIEEVSARLELAENGAEKTKILEIYNILDKKGKINA